MLANIVLLVAPPFAVAKVKVYFSDIFPELQVGLEKRNEEDESRASSDDGDVCAGVVLKGEKRGPDGLESNFSGGSIW